MLFKNQTEKRIGDGLEHSLGQDTELCSLASLGSVWPWSLGKSVVISKGLKMHHGVGDSPV